MQLNTLWDNQALDVDIFSFRPHPYLIFLSNQNNFEFPRVEQIADDKLVLIFNKRIPSLRNQNRCIGL